MAVFTDMVTTSDVQEDDEILLRQGLTDKRINFNLADVIAWGTREGAVYLGDHIANSVYDAVNSFRLFNNQAYFVKVGVTLPYTTTSSNPILDSNLTNMSYADYKRTVDASRSVGDTMLRFDSIKPEDLYPWQSWSLISGDASIRLGNGGSNSTTPSGNNTPVVPLPEHSHPYLDKGNQIISGSGRIGSASSQSYLADIERVTEPTGIDGATLDVRGASIKMNLWVRTA